MRKLLQKRNKGFTLIELMIVVAIIGILAAIAIPNFLRFQLKAKSSEGKVNVAAIRTAEVAYNSEFGIYVTAAAAPAAAALPGTKAVWATNVGFDTLGWAPEGQVYFIYATTAGAAATVNSTSYGIGAQADIDADAASVPQIWGYVHGNATQIALACPMVWDPVAGSATILDQVGPCNALSGQSVF